MRHMTGDMEREAFRKSIVAGNPIHDNNLYRYEFDARTATLVLRTHYQENDVVSEYTDVWFLDVWCHHLEGVLGDDILFGIDDWGLDVALENFGDLFDRLKEQVGWPPVDWRKESLHEAVARMNLHVWTIHSSYGLQGFVIAKEMRILSSKEEAPRLTVPETSA
jgi:hypothetical protein